ncbi:MAG: hypothetical protein WC581_02365 [Thermodesulfovibrionales bacterium]
MFPAYAGMNRQGISMSLPARERGLKHDNQLEIATGFALAMTIREP